MFTSADPVYGGYVKSLARPGGNATGMSTFTNDLATKHLEILLGMMARRPARVGVLLNPSNVGHVRRMLPALQASGKTARVEIVSAEASTAEDLEPAISRLAEGGCAGFLLLTDPFLNQELRQIAALASKYKLPSIGEYQSYAEAGGLCSYGSSARENWRRLASLVDKIFKGANPGEIPVEQPTSLELVVNGRTAKALGVTVSPELLLQAKQVID